MPRSMTKITARHAIALGLAALALAAAGCGDDDNSADTTDTTPAATTPAEEPAVAPTRSKPKVTYPKADKPTKLTTKDLIEGDGPAAKAGDPLTVHYVGVLFSNGEEFDNSYDRGQPFPLQLGAGQVIPGWDQGLVGMKVGGRRRIIIPPELAYGPQGQGSIPPNATLVFVVDLQSIG